MEFPAQNLLAWQVSMTLLQLLAMGMTIFRLVHRWRSHRLWWDDYVVCLPPCLECILVVQIWLKFHQANGVVKINPAIESFWMGAFIYYTILWSCRVALALTLTRIFPPGRRTRQYTLGLAIGFVGTYLGCMIFLMITCRSPQSRYHIRVEYCKTTKNGGFVGSYEFLILDSLSDILLIASPVYMLWRVKLPKSQRRIILSLFSSSILSLLGTIVVFVAWSSSIRPGPDYFFIKVVVGHVESGVSLIACNLLVVVMACYNALRARRSAQQSSTSPQSHTSDKDTTATPREPRSEATNLTGQLTTSSLPQTTLTAIYDDEFESSFRSQ
ncbi:hypothetical protein BYT27DRAFT_7242893 [Phlegmacium glaucopus]|nr:hypothetical protein BYT27DRAFT_7242893 [Phlegmacium glaucopus]